MITTATVLTFCGKLAFSAWAATNIYYGIGLAHALVQAKLNREPRQ